MKAGTSTPESFKFSNWSIRVGTAIEIEAENQIRPVTWLIGGYFSTVNGERRDRLLGSMATTL